MLQRAHGKPLQSNQKRCGWLGGGSSCALCLELRCNEVCIVHTANGLEDVGSFESIHNHWVLLRICTHRLAQKPKAGGVEVCAHTSVAPSMRRQRVDHERPTQKQRVWDAGGLATCVHLGPCTMPTARQPTECKWVFVGG